MPHSSPRSFPVNIVKEGKGSSVERTADSAQLYSCGIRGSERSLRARTALQILYAVGQSWAPSPQFSWSVVGCKSCFARRFQRLSFPLALLILFHAALSDFGSTSLFSPVTSRPLPFPWSLRKRLFTKRFRGRERRNITPKPGRCVQDIRTVCRSHTNGACGGLCVTLLVEVGSCTAQKRRAKEEYWNFLAVYMQHLCQNHHRMCYWNLQQVAPQAVFNRFIKFLSGRRNVAEEKGPSSLSSRENDGWQANNRSTYFCRFRPPKRLPSLLKASLPQPCNPKYGHLKNE